MAHGDQAELLVTDSGLRLTVLQPRKAARAQAARRRERRHPVTATPTTVVIAPVGAQLGSAVPLDPLPGVSNYLRGDDPARWRTNVPCYARVLYQSALPGIDLVLYGQGRRPEYDFVVHPGADPGSIELAFEGIEGLALDGQGDLVLRTAAGTIRQRKPHLYQADGARRHAINGRYVLRGDGQRIGFEVGTYDPAKPLIIDPEVIYALSVSGTAIAADAGGNAYVAGQVVIAADWDVLVSKLSPEGALVYRTYFGGTNRDYAYGIAVDSAGSAYVAGDTRSRDFPTTPGVVGGPEMYSAKGFVTKLDPSGAALAYSTYLGGTRWDIAVAIAVDDLGNAYVTGSTASNDFPTTAGAFHPAKTTGFAWSIAYLAVLNPTATGFVYSTYFGGTIPVFRPDWDGVEDDGLAIAFDRTTRDVFITGITSSRDFPITAGVVRPSNPTSDFDCFVARLRPTASGAASLVYSTFLGGTEADECNGIAVDGQSNAYVIGGGSSDFFPPGTPVHGGTSGPLLAKLNPTASAGIYGYFFTDASAEGVAVDSDGNAYVAGGSDDPNLFMRIVDPRGRSILDSLVIEGGWGGAIAIDPERRVYVTGSLTLKAKGIPPNPFTILHSTTRWRPQRDTAKNVEVFFTGPNDLTGATLEITDPFGAPVSNPAVAFEAIAGTDPPQYKVTWSGPWTTTADATVANPRGDYKLIIVGTQQGGGTVRSAAADPNSTVSLVEVKEIKFMAMAGTPGTVPNTGPGGGDAIFPEAETQGGAVGDRDKVQVITTIDPPITDLRGQGPITVSFRGYDVDDPSATAEPVDLDGDGTPDFVADNRTTPQSGQLRDVSGAEVSGTAMVHIPTSGRTASTIFRVSPRQGDNYRVVASTSRQWLGEIRAFQPSGTGEIRHETARALMADEGDQVSRMLTVWRTLHVEMDHLDSGSVQPSDFEVRGQITKLKPQKLTDKNASFISDASDPVNDHARKDDWEGADLWPKDTAPPTSPPSGTPVNVTGSGKRDLEVANTVDLTTMAAVSDPYRLKDDYWVDLTGGALVAIAQRLLKEVYIDLKLLEAENTTRSLSFRQYLPSFDLVALQRDVRSADIYWAIQVVNAFDGPIGDRRANPPQSGDNDPNAESGVLGQTGGSGPGLQQQDPLQPVCSILNETIRDSALEKGWISDVLGRVTAHEVICHGMKVGHSSGSDLCLGAFDDGPTGDQLTPEQRAELRRLPQPTLN